MRTTCDGHTMQPFKLQHDIDIPVGLSLCPTDWVMHGRWEPVPFLCCLLRLVQPCLDLEFIHTYTHMLCSVGCGPLMLWLDRGFVTQLLDDLLMLITQAISRKRSFSYWKISSLSLFTLINWISLLVIVDFVETSCDTYQVRCRNGHTTSFKLQASC